MSRPPNYKDSLTVCCDCIYFVSEKKYSHESYCKKYPMFDSGEGFYPYDRSCTEYTPLPQL